MTTCGSLLLAASLLAAGAGCAAAAAAPSDAAVAATLKRNAARCRTRSDLDACYDAVRRNPGDPSLSVALGDALVRAKQPADALHTYRRALALAPNTPGLVAKINALDGNPPNKPVVRSVPVEHPPADRTSMKRFSNAAVDGQSH